MDMLDTMVMPLLPMDMALLDTDILERGLLMLMLMPTMVMLDTMVMPLLPMDMALLDTDILARDLLMLMLMPTTDMLDTMAMPLLPMDTALLDTDILARGLLMLMLMPPTMVKSVKFIQRHYSNNETKSQATRPVWKILSSPFSSVTTELFSAF